MSKRIGNPRVYWIRMEMASCQKADAAQAQALSILHDAYLAKGVAKAEMITDADLIKLAAQSVIDGLQLLEEEADASTAEVRSASPADEKKRLTIMPILIEPRDGRLVEVETSTGKIVDHIEIRDGILHYVASDGQTLESKVIGKPHHFVCIACGDRCHAGNLTGFLPDCHKGHPAPEWKESAD